jgi:CRISPR/Cas system-associated protein Cas10 (large subunit of type III CRISPR-Cas system)
MGRKERHSCANCGSKRNVRFYKKLARDLCDRCGSFKVRGMEVVEKDEYENLIDWEERDGVIYGRVQ